MSERRYLPTTLPDLVRDWASEGPEVTDPVVADDDSEESEYAALMTAADLSQALVVGLPDGERRRVVVVGETSSADQSVTWRDVVAVHLDLHDDAGEDDELAWFATQEIGDLLASL